MKRWVLLVVLVCAASVATGVSFPETGTVDEAHPSGIANEVRVEVPYDQNATARQLRDTAGNYTVVIETGNATSKTYIVAKSIITPFEYTEQVVLFANGEQVEYTTVEALAQNWTRVDVAGSTVQLTFVPAATAGGGSFIDRLRFFFLEHSVTILLVSLVGLAALFGMLAFVFARRPSRIEWRRP